MVLLLSLWLAFAAPPPGTVIDHAPAPGGRYIGSPSIVVVRKNTYLASHDFFGPQSGSTTSATTRIFRSRDGGMSWQKTAEFQDQFWSNLFLVRRGLYLMGTTAEYGKIVIRRSGDGGTTWSDPAFLSSDAGYHTAPVPVIQKNGSLWRAFEFHPAGRWGSFQAFLMSAPESADLLRPESWTRTARLPYPANAPEGKTWLEGNAVLGPDGSILDILRVDNIEKAALLALRGGSLHFEGLVDFPGGAKKFTIRFDKKSHRYWTLSNPALEEYPLSKTNPAMVRNTLALLSSRDLHHWTTERIVLSHPDPAKFAFQYADWQFDGKDIVAVSRTAFDDDSGGAHRAHDANFMTFHRIRDFRQKRK
ncbi:MAG TPA: sialidase family protein [Bryobacteraceae bacterium]|nr:sialidase family protein [Bryobacteraceae bacterium]